MVRYVFKTSKGEASRLVVTNDITALKHLPGHLPGWSSQPWWRSRMTLRLIRHWLCP